MMRNRSFLLVFISLTLLVANKAASAEIEYMTTQELRQQIDLFARNYFSGVHTDKILDKDLKIDVGNLDSRLRLARCGQPLEMNVNTPSHMTANATIKTTCAGPHRWSIYVPVDIEVYSEIVVASRTLRRGATISEADLNVQVINIARYGSGHVQDAQRIIGQEVTRSVNAGEAIKLSHVRPAQVVSKGDTVVIEVRGNMIAVAVNGEALENGHVGKQIRVRNNQSKRVVDGVVSGPGRVSISI